MSSSSPSSQPATINTPSKQWLKHLGAYVIMMIVAVLYFKPVAFDGMSMSQHDNVQAVAMQQEIFDYKKAQNGREIYWTNQYFGGMPTALMRSANINHVDSKLVRPMLMPLSSLGECLMLFLIMLGCYIGLSFLGVNWVLAVVLSVVLSFFTANILYIQAGHSGKMIVVSTVPAILGAFVYAYKKNWLLGSSVFAIALSYNLSKNHVQMTYYMAFALGILGLAFTIDAFRKGEIKQWSKFAVGMLIAGILAVGSNIGFLWPSYSYGQESTRGTTALKQKENKSGLEKDYVFGLSFEKAETMTLMFPNFYGATQAKSFLNDPKSETYKAFRNPAIQQRIASQAQGVTDINGFLNSLASQYTRQYRGSQTMSGGPIYYGVVVCFLFILSLLLLRGAYKWSVMASFLLFVVLAWGQHFAVFNDLMYNYFPLYAKFRDTKMTLLVAQSLVILTVGAGMMQLVHFKAEDYADTWSAKLMPTLRQTVSRQGYVMLATAIAVGICAFMALWINMGTLSSPNDDGLFRISPELVGALQADRAALAMGDVTRALGFIVATFGVLWFYVRGTLKLEWAALAIGVLAIADLAMVNSNYLNENSYVKRNNFQEELIPSPQDQAVMKDQGIYRVADYSRGAPSQNAMASAFHKSIGGYFAAKPLLYQEFWGTYQMDNPVVALQQHSNIFNMLNVKYILVPQSQANPKGFMDNPTALGNAWFVEKVEVVADADAELAAIDNLEPLRTAVIQQGYADYIQGLNSTYTAGDRIYLSSYDPDTMVYQSEAANERFAVFSEMYYPPEKGWTVYIDGEEVKPFVKTNYLLRGLRVPAGKHEIKMIFAPQSIVLGRHVGGVLSLIILLIFAFAVFRYYKSKREEPVEQREVIV